MTALEYNKLLNKAFAKLGLSVRLVTESSYMPSTGVIMTPKGTGRVGKVNTPSEAGNPPDQSNPLRAIQDLLNGHWQRDTIDDENVPENHSKDDRVDMGGKTQEQKIKELREINGEEWYRRMRVRLENPDVWEEYLSLN